MKKPENIRHVYFIGIGGIGMSALARYFHSKGIKVSGYDRNSTVLTRELSAEGMTIVYDDEPSTIPQDVDEVVYTPAIPVTNQIIQHFRNKGFTLLKRSDVLQLVSESSFNICIAGTHGKTTISTMTAHLLRHSGYGCNAFLGGIASNYNTNFWSDERNVTVIEADEYDRSFLKLSPDIAVISAMDADHLDIYGTPEAMEQAFIDFSGKVKPEGVLFSKYGLERNKDLRSGNHFTYAVSNDGADIYASNIRIMDGSYRYDVVNRGRTLGDVELSMGGLHNIENSVAAIAVAQELGIGEERIRAAVASFRGVKRRFEYIIKSRDQVFIDDYAHHPEELRALITGAKGLFTGKKCTVVFQPHLFTRTRDLADGFAESLDLADEVILLPIYPARELPIAGVGSEMILERMTNTNKQLLNRVEVLKWITENKPSFLITAGAGDIDQLVIPVSEILNK